MSCHIYMFLVLLFSWNRFGHCHGPNNDDLQFDVAEMNGTTPSLLRDYVLNKRVSLDTGQVYKPAERGIIDAAIIEMVELVDFMRDIEFNNLAVRNVYQYYFPLEDWPQVQKIYKVIGDLYRSTRNAGQPLYQPNVDKTTYRPTNLNQIFIDRDDSCCPPWTLAITLNARARGEAGIPTIHICDLGWKGLYKRLRSDIQCSDLKSTVGKYYVGYEMFYLGAMLMHELM